MLVTVAQCVDNAAGQTVVINPPVHVVTPPVVAQDDYIYYPTYGVYYNSRRHQYAYQDGNAWVSRPTFSGVAPEVLLASPSVKMDFHDSPEHHHAAMVQKYPKTWKSPGANPGKK